MVFAGIIEAVAVFVGTKSIRSMLRLLLTAVDCGDIDSMLRLFNKFGSDLICLMLRLLLLLTIAVRDIDRFDAAVTASADNCGDLSVVYHSMLN